jgi:hypothetical protein
MNLQTAKHLPHLNDLDREVLNAVGDSEVFDAYGYPDKTVVQKLANQLSRDAHDVYYSLKALRVYCSA